MQNLTVDLGDRSYIINIGRNLLNSPDVWSSYCEGENVLILSNEKVAPLYLDTVSKNIVGKNVFHFVLPDGEVEKSLDNYTAILNFLIEKGFRRNDTLIALGGGVVGDLGGFVAASYQRGMGFIQMPTTLLAQVDSSVGGKTAVNHPLGKNMIGAFYQPKVVIIDTNTLDSLPAREFASGLAEVTKYALLGEENLKSILSGKATEVLNKDVLTLTEVVYFSCRKKAEIVAEDEKEQGSRALLNLGHTFGHAIERVSEYTRYFHGEAIAIGMHMAINLSLDKNIISNEVATFYRKLMENLNLPSQLSKDFSVDSLLDAMKLDKKNLSAKYRLVLPQDNCCIIVEEDDSESIQKAIELQYLD